MKENITLEANGEFPFKFFIEKAVPFDENDELIIEGIASTTNVDHDNERMSAEALKDMATIINEKSVPLRVEHSKDGSAVIGNVYKAWVDDRNQLHIRASLDKSHMVAPLLHSSMKQGAKMGLSVGGIVKRAQKEFVESVGKMVKTFYDVILNEVSVTPRPANYDSWLVAKSITDKEEDGDSFRDSSLHNEFLFQNPQLDYLQVFAKSIPDKAWKKININKDNNMDKDKKKEDMTETKSVSRGEFDALKALISKGFDSVGKAISKMSGDNAMDQHQPDKAKPEDESPAAKAEDGAKDTNNPSKKKPADESPTAKAETETEEERTKAEEETETKEKTSDKTEDYKLETVERAIKSIDNLTKKIKKTETETETKEKAESEDETKEKSEEDETETKTKTTKEDEMETTKGIHPLDQFVNSVVKAMTAMNEKMEKSGKTVLGFEKSIMETIKNDPVMQEEIAKMMKIPGHKQSVSMGVPYMVTKEGKRYSLSATEIGTTEVQKSRDDNKGKTFKDVYKHGYSSIKPEE